jgi:hypothetical protein
LRAATAASALVLSSPLAAPVAAQEAKTTGSDRIKVTIDASVRARAEAIDGQFRPGLPASDSFLSFRTTVAARLEIGALTVGGEVIDARGYGQHDVSSPRSSEVNALEPTQAYIAYRLTDSVALGDTATVTLGRFSIDIGSSRLVGRADFLNGAQSYLGAMAEWRSKGQDRVIVFWTHPFAPLPYDAAGIQDNRFELDRVGGNVTFFGASASVARLFGKVGGEFYGYRLAEQDRPTHPTRNRRLATFGLRLRQAPAKGAFDFEAEGAIQRGEVRATAAASDLRDLDVRAGFFHAEAGWTFAKGWVPRVSVMADYASGDGPDSRTYGRFDTLYGGRRADFGPLSLYGPVGRANLVSPGLRVEAKPSKRLDMMAAVRGLWLTERTDTFASTGVRDASGASGRYAGMQVEVRARRWLIPDRLRLEAGGAYLAKGRFLASAPNAPRTGDTRYGFIDLSASF